MTFSEFVTFIYDGFYWIYGDKIQVRQETILKNNGVQYQGLYIHRPGIGISPVINLTKVWDQYQEGTPKEDLLLALILSYQNQSLNMQAFPPFPSGFEEAKPHLILKLVHRNRNKEFLKNVPHREYLDLAIVYGLFYEIDEGHIATSILRLEQLRQWQITEEQLYQAAFANTPLCLPSKWAPLDQWITALTLGSNPFEADVPDDNPYASMLPPFEPEGVSLYILTNERHYLGSSVILYPGFLEDLHHSIQEDFWLIPSSVHEMLLIPKSTGLLSREKEDFLKDLNISVTSETEQLSHRIYSYSSEEGLQIYCGEETYRT